MRILVVDDILSNAKLLELKLSAEYFEVETAFNGIEALAAIKEREPDLVLLDVMMPGMDGFEICRRIKQDPRTAHIPVVMVTALDQPSDRVAGLDAGADDFLTKPVDDAALFARVRSLVRQKLMTDDLRQRAAIDHSASLTSFPSLTFSDATAGRILLVEDRPETVSWIISALIPDNEVSSVDSFEDVFVRARDSDFDLLIVSLGIKGFDGLRVCSQFHSYPKTRDIPILVIVSDGDRRSLTRALEMGVNDYLTRPIDRNELVARVRTQLQKKHYADELRRIIASNVRHRRDGPQVSGPPNLPSQGIGPHFELRTDGAVIDFASPQSLDSDGNNVSRLRSLHGVLQETARDLREGLAPRANQYPLLCGAAQKYLDHVGRELNEIDFALLYGLGLRLEMAEAVTRRHFEDGAAPPLDEAESKTLLNLHLIHGAFILSSAQGQELVADAERYYMRSEDQLAIRAQSSAFGEALMERPDIASRDAAEFIYDAAGSIGEGPHPERNVMLTLHGIANFAVIAGELSIALLMLGAGGIAEISGAWALLRSQPEAKEALTTAEAVFSKLHRTAVEALRCEVPKFLLSQQTRLRRLAELSPRFQFVVPLLDWIRSQTDEDMKS